MENAYGILSSRFKIFKRSVNLDPQKVSKIVLACCHLHNYLSKSEKYIRNNDADFENMNTGEIRPGSWRTESQELISTPRLRGNPTIEAKAVRDEFCEYFNTTGAVPWQYRCLNTA